MLTAVWVRQRAPEHLQFSVAVVLRLAVLRDDLIERCAVRRVVRLPSSEIGVRPHVLAKVVKLGSLHRRVWCKSCTHSV